MRASLTFEIGRRQRPEAPAGSVSDSATSGDATSAEQERIVSALIAQAQGQVGATLSNADSHDAKALGLLAADLAGVAVLLANRSGLDRFWWASLIPAVISALGFGWTLLPRDFSTGPAIDDLYRETIAGSALTAKVALLDALTQAIDSNGRAGARKRLGWAVGALVMLAAAPVCAAYLLVVR